LTLTRPPPTSPLFPYTTLFRSRPAPLHAARAQLVRELAHLAVAGEKHEQATVRRVGQVEHDARDRVAMPVGIGVGSGNVARDREDRKSTRLNSSHDQISYAVFC